MMEESLHTRRKRIIKSYVTRLLLAGQMKIDKRFPPTRIEHEDVGGGDSQDKLGRDANGDEDGRTSVHDEEECERALDDLIAKEEDDDDDDDDEDDEKKKKKKKKEESTPRTLKERKGGWLEKKKIRQMA